MIKFENTEVIGWEHAIRGMRNPMNSWEKSDSGKIYWNGTWYTPDPVLRSYFTDYGMNLLIGPNDLDLNIRKHYVPGDKNFGAKALSERFRVAPQTISAVNSGQNWRD